MNGSTLLRGELFPSHLLGSARGALAGAGSEYALGHPGRCPHSPTLTVFDFDNSGSVSGVSGNDPIASRFVEARLAIEKVSRRCRCGHERAAVLHFDTPTSSDIAPIALKGGGTRRIEQGLRIPRDGAGTSVLGPSLHAAYGLAEQHPDHESVLVVLSDFELFDNDVPGVLKEFVDFPGTVHAVVLRATPPAVLLEDDRVTVTHIDYADPPGAVAKAVFEALITHRR